MSKILFASDLDATLLYSAARLAADPPQSEMGHVVVAEYHEKVPFGYTPLYIFDKLRQLVQEQDLVFAPVTTRTREQYARTKFSPLAPNGIPAYAAVANGAEILLDGKTVDKKWSEQISHLIADNHSPFVEFKQQVADIASKTWIKKFRSVETYFFYLVMDRNLVPPQFIASCEGLAADNGWKVSLQGRKMYFVPRKLTKQLAVEEIQRRTGAETVVSAGDSLLDVSMLTKADVSIRPAHGELEDTGFHLDNLIVTSGRGINSALDILDIVENVTKRV